MTDKKKIEKYVKEFLKEHEVEIGPLDNDSDNYKWCDNTYQYPAGYPGIGGSVSTNQVYTNYDPIQRILDKLEAIEERLREIEELPIINLLKEGARNDEEDEKEEK